MILLPSQKNKLYELISETSYFSPSMFDLQDFNEEFVLKCKATDFYFRIDKSRHKTRDFEISFSPAKSKIADKYYTDWDDLIGVFYDWLHNLEREVVQVDKWGRLIEEIKYLNVSKQQSEQKFSHKEFLVLQNQFSYIKRSIASVPLLPEQLEAINSKLDHLLEISTELNKFDWQSLFIGTIVSIIIQLGVTPENAQLLYGIIKQTFSGYFLK